MPIYSVKQTDFVKCYSQLFLLEMKSPDSVVWSVGGAWPVADTTLHCSNFTIVSSDFLTPVRGQTTPSKSQVSFKFGSVK